MSDMDIIKWFNFKRGDTLPSIVIDVKNLDADITGKTVKFYMRRYDDKTNKSTELKVDGIATVVSCVENPVGSNIWEAKIKYMWDLKDLATIGDFIAEFQILFAPSPGVLSLPSNGYIGVRIYQDVD